MHELDLVRGLFAALATTDSTKKANCLSCYHPDPISPIAYGPTYHHDLSTRVVDASAATSRDTIYRYGMADCINNRHFDMKISSSDPETGSTLMDL